MRLIVKILNYLYNNKRRIYNFGKIDNIGFIYRYDKVEDENYLDTFGAVIEKIKLFKLLTINIIVFNISFDDYDEETKKFIIYHEIGHDILHLSKLFNDDLLTKEEKIMIEHEADMYAVKHTSWQLVHKSLRFLLNDTLINNPQNKSLIELIKARIQFLEINKD